MTSIEKFADTTSDGIQGLLIKQKITPKGLEKIKQYHWEREKIIEMLTRIGKLRKSDQNTADLKKWATSADLIDLMIQRAWNYEVNYKHHKFWTLPHCDCPIEQNEDVWPKGPYVYNVTCRLHNDRI